MHQSEMRELDALVAMAESFDPKALLERLSAAFAKTAAAKGDEALKRAAEATQGAAKRLGDEDPPEDEAEDEDSDDGEDTSDDEAQADGDEEPEDEDEEPEAEDEEPEAAASHRKRAPKMLMKKTHWRAKMVMADGAKRTLFFDEESSTPDVGASEWGIRSFRGTATLKERWRVERPTDFIVYYFGTDAEGHRRPMGKGAPVHVQPSAKPLHADTPSAAAAPRDAAFEGGDDPTLRALKFMETQRANNRAELRSEQEQRAKMDLELRRIASQERIELAKIQPPAPAAESSPAITQLTAVLQGLAQQLQQQKEEIQKIRETAAVAKQDSIDKIIEVARPFLTGLAARQEAAPTRTVVQLVRGGRDGSGEPG